MTTVFDLKESYTLSEIKNLLNECKKKWVHQEYGGGKTYTDYLIKFAIIDLTEITLTIEKQVNEPDVVLRGENLFIYRVFQIIQVFQKHCSDFPSEVPSYIFTFFYELVQEAIQADKIHLNTEA